MKGSRDITTVAPQALFMMNSDFVRSRARAAAEKLLSDSDMDDAERVDRAYRIAIGRLPTDKQRERILSYVKKVSGKSNSQNDQKNVWTSVYHALFASAEFRYVN